MSGTSTGDRTRPGLKRRMAADPAWLEVEARRAEQRRRRDRSLIRHGVALVLLLAITSLLYAVRDAPDPAFPAAVELAERMDRTFAAVAAGELELTPTPRQVAPGIAGATAVSFGREIGVLTGEAGGECYAHWWDAGLVRHARVLQRDMPCVPASIVTSIRPIHFDRLGPVFEGPGPYPWDALLPDPIRQRTWLLPAMVVAGGVGLSIVTRITTTLITGKPPGQQSREERERKRRFSR